MPHLYLTLKIDSGNAAIADDPAGEAARILRNAADKLEAAAPLDLDDPQVIRARDFNGNVVGSLSWLVRSDD